MARISAADRARRLLAVLHLFEPGTEIPLERIADALGTTTDAIADDLELLACCGVAPYTPEALLPLFIDEGNVVVWGELPALDRAVRLSATEARALATALGTAGIDTNDPLLVKLLSAASPEGDGQRVADLARAGVSAGSPVLKSLTLALEQHHPIALVYRSAGSEADSERTVEPMGLVHERGQWYLEAFCRTSGALRTFRVDRIRSADVLEEVFVPRELSPTGSAFVSAGLPVARIRLAPGEEFSSRDWPGARHVETEEDGSAVVEVPFAGTGWIARQVVSRLGGARVLSPPEVREAVVGLARAELRALGDD